MKLLIVKKCEGNDSPKKVLYRRPLQGQYICGDSIPFRKVADASGGVGHRVEY